MTMQMFGCQGRDRTPTLAVKHCPKCGNEVEVFSIDTSIECEKCGTPVYNDAIDCVQWCQYAKACVGEEEYDRLMEIAKMRSERAKAEAAAKRAEERERKAREAAEVQAAAQVQPA